MQAAPELPRFMQRQYQFTAHLRAPQQVAPPADVAEERMAIYRELIYNNVEQTLANAFPVLRRISRDAYWHGLVRDFFTQHRAATPFFPRLPGEFLLYLESSQRPAAGDFPFLLELAQHEWAELALSISDECIDETGIAHDGNLLSGVPVLSPLIRHCAYRYPVHRIGPGYLPEQAPDTPSYLVVYRDRDDAVGFLELNPASSQLLQCLQENDSANGEQLLRQLAAAIGHPNSNTVVATGLQLLETLRQHDVVLGTHKADDGRAS
jgi:hypothetical protein